MAWYLINNQCTMLHGLNSYRPCIVDGWSACPQHFLGCKFTQVGNSSRLAVITRPFPTALLGVRACLHFALIIIIMACLLLPTLAFCTCRREAKRPPLLRLMGHALQVLNQTTMIQLRVKYEVPDLCECHIRLDEYHC